MIEAPYTLILLWGVLLNYYYPIKLGDLVEFPKVAVNLTCYSEGNLIELAIKSIAIQNYPLDKITILVTVDGGSKYNAPTVESGYKMQSLYKNLNIVVIDKDDRYGRVHSNNLGLQYCKDNDIPYMLILDGDTSISAGSLLGFIKIMEHDKDLAGCSGSIKVRNLNSITTKLTYIEYALGIVLSRFGLSKLGYVNNLSGAFSMFRISSIDKINGWRPNSAEDYDLTLRIAIHKMKVTHCREAIAYTDSPETLKELLKQRWLWSGDLLFLTNKYFHYLTPCNLGLRAWFFIWYNKIVTICLPICILAYFGFLLIFYSPGGVFLICLIIYVLYMYISFFMYILYLSISEDKVTSYKMFSLVPLLPIYSCILRLNDLVAFYREIVYKQHLDSKMGPKHVFLESHYEPDNKYFNL